MVARVAIVITAMAIMAAGGLTVDLTRYAQATEGRLLVGTTIAGVDVGGLLPADAHERVSEVIAPQLDRTTTLTYEGRTWTATATELGVSSDLDEQVTIAAGAARIDWMDRARTRYLGRVLGPSLDVTVSVPTRAAVEAFVRNAAFDLDTDPVDATLEVGGGTIAITPHRVGLAVDQQATADAVASAWATAGPEEPIETAVAVTHPEPEVRTERFRQVLYLDQSDHRLDLYLEGRRAHSYTVAVGTGEHPTPLGRFEITLKRYRPTWINPAPTGWGKHMPARIGPGPDNPLGVRALNWNVGAIRFHGTANIDSLGTDASHGCVRLSNGDIVHLYELVDTGAVIVSVR